MGSSFSPSDMTKLLVKQSFKVRCVEPKKSMTSICCIIYSSKKSLCDKKNGSAATLINDPSHSFADNQGSNLIPKNFLAKNISMSVNCHHRSLTKQLRSCKHCMVKYALLILNYHHIKLFWRLVEKFCWC